MPRETGARLAEGVTKGTAYVRTNVFPARVNSPKHVLLLTTVRSLGPFSTIFEGRISLVATYANNDSDTSGALPGCLHCMSFALACAYLALGCMFASLFVLADTPCMRARVLCLCGPYMHVCSAPACVCPVWHKACMRVWPAHACTGRLCARASHLLACDLPVPARVPCAAFGRHAALWWVPPPRYIILVQQSRACTNFE